MNFQPQFSREAIQEEEILYQDKSREKNTIQFPNVRVIDTVKASDQVFKGYKNGQFDAAKSILGEYQVRTPRVPSQPIVRSSMQNQLESYKMPPKKQSSKKQNTV